MESNKEYYVLTYGTYDTFNHGITPVYKTIIINVHPAIWLVASSENVFLHHWEKLTLEQAGQVGYIVDSKKEKLEKEEKERQRSKDEKKSKKKFPWQ